uniref:DNA/RNA non-specific endonuclease n=1 Tax=uncultured Caulobacter sp. TaxID=158749 RepID=UPI0025FB46F3|nr:DNA/RNA non-specific endonuclease [uncultured Caulobacter sp.]
MTDTDRVTGPRRDIVATDSSALSEAVAKAVDKTPFYVPAAKRAERASAARSDRRFLTRKTLIESSAADPNGFERIIGASDLLSINFLDRGRRAAAAVCRIKVPADGGPWYGTGFLVGPRLLLTNHHVLGNPDEASQADAQFAYEHDLDGALQDPVRFNLAPHEVFYTNAELDFTFVAVTPLSDNNVPLTRFGRLPLLPISGKAVEGEWVSIIQHPGGEPKQIAIHASQVLALDPAVAAGVDLNAFIHYSTDTEPGSSGAPVMNDQWQVLALHHKAVPDPAYPPAPGVKPVFIANEGVRVSAIFSHLEANRFQTPQAGVVLNRLEGTLGLSPMSRGPGESAALLEADRSPLPVTRWADVSGYDRDFLSVRIDLDQVIAPMRALDRVAPLLDGGEILKYSHYSAVIHKQRKFPLLTAVNVDGARLIHPGERKNTWRRDARIADEYQPAGNFYEKNKGTDPVQFSRGHQVRLLDPCWGADKAEAAANAEETFHYTNAAPQVQGYNDVDWGNLEDYLLNKAQLTEQRLTIFTGPIYRDDDPWYGHDREDGPWRIPLSFWKIAVLQKTATVAKAAAFIVGQTQYVQALYEAKVFSGLKPYTLDEMRSRNIQTTVAAIQAETGLDFSDLRAIDAQGSLESTRQTRWIRDVDEIAI